jgi:hypothetical protein
VWVGGGVRRQSLGLPGPCQVRPQALSKALCSLPTVVGNGEGRGRRVWASRVWKVLGQRWVAGDLTVGWVIIFCLLTSKVRERGMVYP